MLLSFYIKQITFSRVIRGSRRRRECWDLTPHVGVWTSVSLLFLIWKINQHFPFDEGASGHCWVMILHTGNYVFLCSHQQHGHSRWLQTLRQRHCFISVPLCTSVQTCVYVFRLMTTGRGNASDKRFAQTPSSSVTIWGNAWGQKHDFCCPLLLPPSLSLSIIHRCCFTCATSLMIAQRLWVSHASITRRFIAVGRITERRGWGKKNINPFMQMPGLKGSNSHNQKDENEYKERRWTGVETLRDKHVLRRKWKREKGRKGCGRPGSPFY